MHEVTTFRRDVETDGRHAVVEYGASLDDDLARRDFTINAIAYHPLRDEWRDPHGGERDLERRRGARGRRSGGAVPGGLPPDPSGDPLRRPVRLHHRARDLGGRARGRAAASAGSRPSGCGTSGSRAFAPRASWARWCGSGASRARRPRGCPSCAGRPSGAVPPAALSPPTARSGAAHRAPRADPAGLLRRLRASNAEIARAPAMAAGPAEPAARTRSRSGAGWPRSATRRTTCSRLDRLRTGQRAALAADGGDDPRARRSAHPRRPGGDRPRSRGARPQRASGSARRSRRCSTGCWRIRPPTPASGCWRSRGKQP